MGRLLTGDEFAEALQTFDHTAFRLELQPEYAVPLEQELLAQFKSGKPRPPDEVPGLREWFAQVREQTRQGKRVVRVRVHDEPPTDYQRMVRWADSWNTEAGEKIRYVTRQQAYEIGLLPSAGPLDWWLLDSRMLLLMAFGPDHRVVRRELVTDPSAVVQAAVWRDLAVHYSLPSNRYVAA